MHVEKERGREQRGRKGENDIERRRKEGGREGEM